MTKNHATNPGVVRERRQKAAIEKRAEKQAGRRFEYCRTCGRTLFVEWPHRDHLDDIPAELRGWL